MADSEAMPVDVDSAAKIAAPDSAASQAAPKRKTVGAAPTVDHSEAVRARSAITLALLIPGVLASSLLQPSGNLTVVLVGLPEKTHPPALAWQEQDDFVVNEVDEAEALEAKEKQAQKVQTRTFDSIEAEYYLEATQVVAPKAKIQRQELLESYAELAFEHGAAPIPSGDMGQDGPYGPFQFYCFEENLKQIVKSGKLVVSHARKDAEPMAIELVTRLVRVFDDGARPIVGRTSARFVEQQTVHIIAHLQKGPQFRTTELSHVKRGLIDAGFIVFRANQKNVVVDGERTNIRTEEMHFNVRPREGTIVDAPWPALIETKVQYLNHKELVQRTWPIKYEMVECPQLPAAKFCLRVCHAKKPCPCDRTEANDAKRPNQGAGGGSSSEGGLQKKKRGPALSGMSLGAPAPTPRARTHSSACVRAHSVQATGQEEERVGVHSPPPRHMPDVQGGCHLWVHPRHGGHRGPQDPVQGAHVPRARVPVHARAQPGEIRRAHRQAILGVRPPLAEGG